MNKPKDVETGIARLAAELQSGVVKWVYFAMVREGWCSPERVMSWRTQYLSLTVSYLRDLLKLAEDTLLLSKDADRQKVRERNQAAIARKAESET